MHSATESSLHISSILMLLLCPCCNVLINLKKHCVVESVLCTTVQQRVHSLLHSAYCSAFKKEQRQVNEK